MGAVRSCLSTPSLATNESRSCQNASIPFRVNSLIITANLEKEKHKKIGKLEDKFGYIQDKFKANRENSQDRLNQLKTHVRV